MSAILPNRITSGPSGGGTQNAAARWGSGYGELLDSPQVKISNNSSELEIICGDANTSAIKITSAIGQIADIFKIASNDGSSLFKINYQGDIGITVESPNEPFHVQSDYNGNRAIRMGNESDGNAAVGRFIVDVLGGSTFLAGYGSNFATSGSKRANSGSLIANASMSGGLSLVTRHPTTGHLRFYTGGNADVNERVTILADGKIGFNVNDPDSQVEIETSSASIPSLHLKSAASQTENILKITDNNDNNLAWVTKGGKIQTEAGVRATGNQWGDCFAGWRYDSYKSEHDITNNAGGFDATGSGYGERLFYDTVNSPFTQTDEDNKNYIVIKSGDKQGAKAQILEYIDASRVLICCCGLAWNEDLSGVNYSIYKSPQIDFGDGPANHINVGRLGGFRVENTEGTFLGDTILCVGLEAGMDNIRAMRIMANAGGFNEVDAFRIEYTTGDLQSGDHAHAMHITINEVNATSGHIDGIIIQTTNASSAEKGGIHIGPGFDHAFSVTGSSVSNPDYGYEVTTSTVVDRVNSGGAGDDAFINAGVNQTLFDNDNDYILIGSDNTFEVISVILNTVSSKDLLLTFYYSKAGGNWTQFYPTDGTNGFLNSGLISFPAPGDWTKDDEAEANGDITDAYYIKIVRTYNFVVPVLPIESYFKVYEEQVGDTGMDIRGDGAVKFPYLTSDPGNLSNGLVWFESDGMHIYYNGAEKLVAGV